jgi:hypothetical protein
MIPLPAVAAQLRASVARGLRRRAAGPRGLALAALLLLAALGLVAPVSRAALRECRAQSHAAEETTEYELKAMFLLHFASRYVKWPETASEAADSPLYVGVLGKDPFGKHLDRALRGKLVGEHPIVVRRFDSIDQVAPCHLLFVPESQEKHLAKLRESHLGKPVLIVAESIAAAQRGAHIGVYMERSKGRFAICPEAAKQSKLEISSELLKLAKIVEYDPLEEHR